MRCDTAQSKGQHISFLAERTTEDAPSGRLKHVVWYVWNLCSLYALFSGKWAFVHTDPVLSLGLYPWLSFCLCYYVWAPIYASSLFDGCEGILPVAAYPTELADAVTRL